MKKIKLTQALERLSDEELITQLCSSLPVVTKKRVSAIQLAELKYYLGTDWEKLLLDDPTYYRWLRLLCEFAKRYNEVDILPLGVVCSSKVIGEHLIKKLGNIHQETLMGVYLDTKNQLLAEKKIFVGTLDSATVHPREIFKYALSYSTARFIVAHNHPSGQVEPSPNDLALTKRLTASGKLLGIPLLDHIIVGKDSYFSFRENELLKK